jgi:hypothetical protein
MIWDEKRRRWDRIGWDGMRLELSLGLSLRTTQI